MSWTQIPWDASNTEVTPLTRGQSASILINQQASDPGGWRVELFAVYEDTGSVFVGDFTVSDSGTKLHMVRCGAVCSFPGASRLIALVNGPGGGPPRFVLEIAIVCNPGGMLAGITLIDP